MRKAKRVRLEFSHWELIDLRRFYLRGLDDAYRSGLYGSAYTHRLLKRLKEAVAKTRPDKKQ